MSRIIFTKAKNISSWTKHLRIQQVRVRMNSPELEQRVKELVQQAQKKENGGLRLSNIARQCDVPYNRLYRFMQMQDPLWSGDAQRIYEKLSGKPLLPTTDAL